MLGATLGLLSLSGMFFINRSVSWVIYILILLTGCSTAMVMGTGINLISDVVGSKGSKGAFVFGIYSFMDKSIVGLAVYFIIHSKAYTKLDEPT